MNYGKVSLNTWIKGRSYLAPTDLRGISFGYS